MEKIGDMIGVRVDGIEERLSGEEGDDVEVSLECEDDEEEFDSDSGMGSDDFDLLEVGSESGMEFCQVGDQTCSVSLKLYDLSDLSEVLSLEVWNECLSKDEKWELCNYLPDMDQGMFMRTLKDLLSGENICFGNPVSVFFNMLKGGLCEPSVSLRRQGLLYFQKQQYYHFLRSYQNNMFSQCLQIREVWSYRNALPVEDKINILNVMRKPRKIERGRVHRGLEGKRLRKDENFKDVLMRPKVFPKLVEAGQKNKSGHDSRLALSIKNRLQDGNDTSRIIYDAIGGRDRNIFDHRAMAETGFHKMKKRKKNEYLNANGFSYKAAFRPKYFMKKTMSEIKALRSKGKYHEMSVPNSQDAIVMDFYSKEVQNGNGNNDTESDSSDLRGEQAYGHRLNNVARHNKRKKGSRPQFEVATSSKKFMNLCEHLLTVDNQTPKIKRKSYDRNHFARNSGNQFCLNEQAVNIKGLRTRGGQLVNNCSSPEFAVEEDDTLFEAPDLIEGAVGGRLSRGKKKKIFLDDICEDSNIPILQCLSVKKKSKGGKVTKKSGKFHNAQSGSLQRVDSEAMQPADTYAMESEMMTVEPDPTPHKKTYTIITPTVDCSFMFSVIHLLSAVRIALITPCLEDTLQHENQEAQSMISGEVSNGIHPNGSIEGNNSERPGQSDKRAFSIHEIVNRVRLNPGDPCMLETPEPLLDLVRGVLKLFSSKSAPQGAKNWKPIAKYERASRSWSWIGPLNHTVSDTESIEVVTSHEAWGLPHRMLVKLVDAFAIWLKNSQEILRELRNLPPPPASLMQFNIDEKERLKDMRAQKSLSTIGPSTKEVRAYFRKEEYLRYSIPDRAFTYTAADGRKSTVAPLRRGGGKPSAKARDHLMLKSDRPAHVTILCLVRDAAARLPGSIGTRADVVTLIRDSQYITEDVTDNQVTQILSGALDRLHYEQDPCVKFEQERKLWVYLHRDREEEDFDENGTLSTKKWKKPKKEAADQATDMVVVDGEQTANMVADAQLDLVSNQSMGATATELDFGSYQSMETTAPQLGLVSYQSMEATAPQLDLVSYQSIKTTAPQLDLVRYPSMEATVPQLNSVSYVDAAATQFDLLSYQSVNHHNHDSVRDNSGFNGAF